MGSISRPNIPMDIRRDVLVEAGHRCAISTCRHSANVDLHHIVPWSQCQKHECENLIVLCPNCHRAAHDGTIDRRALLKYKAQLSEIPPEESTLTNIMFRPPIVGDIANCKELWDLFEHDRNGNIIDMGQRREVDKLLEAMGTRTHLLEGIEQIPEGFPYPLEKFIGNYLTKYRKVRSLVENDPVPDGMLEFTTCDPDTNSVEDIGLRNLSDDPVYITKVRVIILAEQGYIAGPVEFSAFYKINLENKPTWTAKEKKIRFKVAPRDVDRFQLKIKTDLIQKLYITLFYNKQYSVSHIAGIGGYDDDEVKC